MGMSSKEVSSVAIGSDRVLPVSSSSPSPSSSSSQQKQQQPEPLKCPRCDSTNTKFCYYNNYNKSQPRHFCKACKRHWTKGGTLRNVPVGGGRKNKRKISNTSAIKTATKTTTAATTAALISGISNTNMTIQPQQQPPPRLNLPLGSVLGGVDEKNLSQAFYQTLGRHPPCSKPETSIAFLNNENNNGVFLGSSLSLPPNDQGLNFPSYSNLGANFESDPCSIVTSIQSSNLYNYTADQAENSLEETIMNSLNTNLSSSSMSMGDHQHHQQSWAMTMGITNTNTSSAMGITSNWGWDEIEKFVTVDEAELTIPWDDADIKP